MSETTKPAARTEETPGRLSRRRFLGTVGAGAAATGAAIATGGVLTRESAHASHPPATRGDRFGRMFPHLPPFAEATPQVKAALAEMGKKGGLLDANDAISAGPVALIVDPALNTNNPNNPTHTAGTTFMGQFLDHDITFEPTSRLGVPTSPEATTNFRKPSFDLDSVYLGGPAVSPQLYDRNGKLRCESMGKGNGAFEDLPRAADGTAIIGDPRNDENAVLQGLHAAFLLFHNTVHELLASDRRRDRQAVYTEARRLTTWHYQWMIVHEFLPQFVGQAMVDEVMQRGRRFYRPSGEAFIPVEFQTAAYRMGHSMIRPSYRLNMQGDEGAPFFAFIFDPAGEGQDDPVDLRGGRNMRRFVGWQTFFDFGADPFTGVSEVKPNKLIDRNISSPLFDLPLGTLPVPEGPTSLPARNLLRHLTWQLPSGQDVAREMHVPHLTPADLGELREFRLGFEHSTPLWYYILAEAEIMEGGLRLGPVGGRIVAEVFIGLLELDSASYLSVQPNWRPTLPAKYSGNGSFRMIDFLALAGVDPESRGQ